MSETMHDHQQCRAFFEKLSEYIDHELDLDTLRAAIAHDVAQAKEFFAKHG